MPISRGTHLSALAREIKKADPSSVLDVGVGFGLTGALVRTFTDIRHSERDPSRYPREGWTVVLDGVEVHEAYRSPLWDLYDDVLIGDALDVLPRLGGRYDFAYCGDVIEHLREEDGRRLIDLLLDSAARVVLATPYPAPKQDTLLDNPHEAHLSSWSPWDVQTAAVEAGGTTDRIEVRGTVNMYAIYREE